MTLATAAVRGGAITLAAQAGRILLSFSSVVILARMLTPYDFGVVAMAVAVVGVADLVRDFGLSTAAIQAPVLSRTQGSNLFWINSGIGCGCGIVVFLSSNLIASFFDQPELVGVVQALAATFVLGGVATQFKVQINRQLRFGRLAVIEVGSPLLGLIAALIVSLSTRSYWVIVAQLLTTAVAALLLSVCCAGWWPGLPHRSGHMRKLLSMGLDLFGTQLVAYVAKNIDSIAIGRVWGPSQLGIYDRAYQVLVVPLNQLNAPLSRVAIPIFSRLSPAPVRFFRAIRTAQLLSTYLTGTIFAVAAALALPIVTILFGDDWVAAAPVLAVLALGGIFRSLLQVCFWIYTSLGLTRAQLKFYLVGQPLLVVVILLGLPWGILGVAIGHSVGYLLYWVASIWWVGRIAGLDVRPLVRDAARTLGLFAVPVGLAAFFAAQLVAGYWRQALVGSLAAVIMAGVLALVLRPVGNDLRALVRLTRGSMTRAAAVQDPTEVS